MIVIGVEKFFEAWNMKPMSVNKYADFYNDTFIRMRREKIEKKSITSLELCWLSYARYLDKHVAPDEVVFDAGANEKLAKLANLWFGDDSVLLNGRPLCEQ